MMASRKKAPSFNTYDDSATYAFFAEVCNKRPDSPVLAAERLVEGGTWYAKPCYGVVGIEANSRGKLVFKLSSMRSAWTAARLMEEISKIGGVGSREPLYCSIRGKMFKVIGVFGHNTLPDKLAGLPVEIVLGIG